MQTILGGGGAIGIDLARALKHYTQDIRIVARNPKKVNDTDTLLKADLTSRDEVLKAIAGSEVVYVTIGFEYKAAVWEKLWPAFMRNVIDGCKLHQAKLVFFDNVYMYDPMHIAHMTEATPVSPTSRKGKVRAQIAQMLTNEMELGTLFALIARSADFYGPGIERSVLQETVQKNFAKGKKAAWMARADKVHTFTYTPDAAKATALLGNTPDAYNQVWHLPTDKTRLTGKQWIELFAQEMQVPPKFRVLPVSLMSVLGIFMSIMRELREMAYQYEKDYFFDSSKFEARFNIKATPPQEAVKQIVQYGKA